MWFFPPRALRWSRRRNFRGEPGKHCCSFLSEIPFSIDWGHSKVHLGGSISLCLLPAPKTPPAVNSNYRDSQGREYWWRWRQRFPPARWTCTTTAADCEILHLGMRNIEFGDVRCRGNPKSRGAGGRSSTLGKFRDTSGTTLGVEPNSGAGDSSKYCRKNLIFVTTRGGSDVDNSWVTQIIHEWLR